MPSWRRWDSSRVVGAGRHTHGSRSRRSSTVTCCPRRRGGSDRPGRADGRAHASRTAAAHRAERNAGRDHRGAGHRGRGDLRAGSAAVPGELPRPRGAVRGGALGLAVPDAVAQARRSAARGGRRGVPLRADLARPRHGWRTRRLSRPGRAAGVRQPHRRSAGDVDRRPHAQKQRRCRNRCATRGRRSRRTAIPAGPRYDTGATRLFDVEPAVTDYPEQVSRKIWRNPPDVLDLARRGQAPTST